MLFLLRQWFSLLLTTVPTVCSFRCSYKLQKRFEYFQAAFLDRERCSTTCCVRRTTIPPKHYRLAGLPYMQIPIVSLTYFPLSSLTEEEFSRKLNRTHCNIS
jgi:hypothetical protein